MKQFLSSIKTVAFALLFILTTSLLMGISSPLESTAYATLRIYKKGYYTGWGSGFGLKINDQMVIKRLKNKSWIEVNVPIGKLTLETVPEVRYPTDEGKSFSIQVEAGKLYYLEAVIDYEFLISSMYLVLREESRGEAEISRLKQEKNVIQRIE